MTRQRPPTVQSRQSLDPAWLGRRLGDLGCRSTRDRVPTETGRVRQIRGYLTAGLYATAQVYRNGRTPDGEP